MKRIFGEYAYPIIIIVGFCMLVLISWLFNKINSGDQIAFWASVLPSAFVDVISLVVSTILITKIIDRKKIYNEKSRLYKIINKPHKRLIDLMLLEYMYLIANKHANYFTREVNLENFKVESIAPYFRENVHKNFQKDVLVMKEKTIEVVDGVEYEGRKDKEVLRLELMEKYHKNINQKITDYIKEYNPILTTEYLVLLMDIKEEIKSNPLRVHSFFGDSDYIPSIINVEDYILRNQKYMDSILKLIRYFNDIDVQGIWEDKKTSEWGVIGLIIGLVFIIYILISVGELLIRL